jgi:CRP-like cAMP-binding protein
MPHIDLLELPYFADIDIGDMVSLIDAMIPRQFVAGQALMTEGDPAPTPLYILLKGEVAITTSRDGPKGAEPWLVATQQGPTIIGEVELFLAQPATRTVTATTAASTFVLEPATFKRLYAERHPALMPFLYHVAQVACARLVDSDHKVMRAAHR